VSVGVKITDYHRRHPITKTLLLIQDDEAANCTKSEVLNEQSRELCCILVMADARDSSLLYSDVFKEYYNKEAKKVQNERLSASEHGPALRPFDLMYPQDLSAMRKASGLGGACKNAHFFVSCVAAPVTRFCHGEKAIIGVTTVSEMKRQNITIIRFVMNLGAMKFQMT